MEGMMVGNLNKLLAALVVVIGITGCAGNQIANNDALSQQARQLASNTSLTPEQAILNAAQKIEKGKDDQLAFYAPLHLEEAKEALLKAQDLKASGEPSTLVLEQAFKVDSIMKAAYQNKDRVKDTLAKSLENHEILKSLDTPGILPEEFQRITTDLKELIKDIESGKITQALEGQTKLLGEIKSAEILTLKKTHLSEAESMLEKAESAEAEDYAPKTFNQAVITLQNANSYIEKNFRNRAEVKQQGFEALNAATHAYFVAKEGQELVGLDEDAVENKVLYFESLLERINKTVGIKHLNTMSLYDQSVALAKKVEEDSRKAIAVAPLGAPAVNPVVQPVVTNQAVTPKTVTPVAVTPTTVTPATVTPTTVTVPAAAPEPAAVPATVMPVPAEPVAESTVVPVENIQPTEANKAIEPAKSAVVPVESKAEAIQRIENQTDSALDEMDKALGEQNGQDAVAPVAVESVSSETTSVVPESVEPVTAEPLSSEAASVTPEVVEPIAAEPVAVAPVVVEPETVEPEPVAVEPVTIAPAAVKPEVVEPEVVEPADVAPKVVEAETVEPEVVEPEPVVVQPVEAEPVEPEPIVVEPVEVEPVDVEPQVTEQEDSVKSAFDSWINEAVDE